MARRKQIYRSKLEERVAKTLPDAEYEPWQIDYTVPHKYTPDFVEGHIVYEVKGFFRTGDQQKYIAISKHLYIKGYIFKFILSHPDKPVRKGTKLSMSKWCEKHSIPWQKA